MGVPRTSVLMPAYNPRGDELVEAVDSVLAQTVEELELIIVDDGSAPSVAALLDRRRDPRLRLLRHARNRGLSAARNTGLREARAPLVSHLDSDDVWQPEYLEQVIDTYSR